MIINLKTYPSGCAGADVVRQAGDIMRIAHEDSHLDSRKGRTSERSPRAATKGIIHDLTTLSTPKSASHNFIPKPSYTSLKDTGHTCE